MSAIESGANVEASERGLLIDTDDKLAAYGTQSFALMENFKGEKVK